MFAPTTDSPAERRRLERLDRESLLPLQLSKLNALLSELRGAGGFYAKKLAAAPKKVASQEDLQALPFTSKEDLQGESQDDALNRTYDRSRYVRFHQTSGSRAGR